MPRILRYGWIILLFVVAGSRAGQSEPPSTVLELSVHGVIDPPTSEYVRDGIAKAEAAHDAAILIELDTPGGLLDATRQIIQSILNTPLPVIVYVSPSGARATSAGAFLTMASDVAVMAPGTHIGAAHPVTLGGGFTPAKSAPASSSSVMEEKVLSDASAFMRTLAHRKNRNAAWAEQAVRQSVSLTADEALTQHVIDLVAPNRTELFKALDGRTLEKNGRTIHLALSAATVESWPMSALRRFLHGVANPDFAYLLLMFGIYAIIYEFISPTHGLGALLGVVSLLLAAYALSILPVNGVSLVLLVLGIVFLALELKVASHGLLTVSGLVILVLGSVYLFNAPEPYMRVSWSVIAGVVAASGGFFGFAVTKILEARRRRPAVGIDTLVGETGEVRQALSPRGMIFVDGELWSAEAPSEISVGTPVRVVAVRGRTLQVRKLERGEQNA